jgi:hypothetical protein
VPTCSDSCELVNACKCIDKDPAIIKFGKNGKLDSVKIHGRVLIDPNTLDPLTDGFGFHLSNILGTIASADLPGSELIERTHMRWKYQNKLAKSGADAATPYKGLAKVGLRVRILDGLPFLTFKFQAWGDFSLAFVPLMTTQVYGFQDAAVLTYEWTERKNGWILRAGDYPPCAMP